MKIHDNGKRPDERKKSTDAERRKVDLIIKALTVLLFFLMMLFVILLLRACSGKDALSAPPEYEEGAEYEDDGNPKADPERLNIAVLPDYTVTASSPYILIPYPKENANDVEFVFREQDTGDELYRTKRIRPGMVVRIDAYDFAENGKNEIFVEVKLFNHKTWEEIASAVALETEIRRK